MRVTRAESAPVYSKTPLLLPQTPPLFGRKPTLPQPNIRSTRPCTCPLVGFALMSGRKTPQGQSKGQSNEALNLFRAKGGNEFFISRFTPHTRKKEGSFAFSRSSFHHSDLFCYICTLNCCAHFALTHSASPSRLQVGAAAPTGFALKSDRRSPGVKQERYCTRNKIKQQ